MKKYIIILIWFFLSVNYVHFNDFMEQNSALNLFTLWINPVAACTQLQISSFTKSVPDSMAKIVKRFHVVDTVTLDRNTGRRNM